MFISVDDLLVLWHDLWVLITWVVAISFLVSGLEDLWYDVTAIFWRVEKRIRFKKRPRLNVERLRLREQQSIALMIPAWDEGEVVSSMVDNIIKRVEYKNYHIFIGVYPNDDATNQAVDDLVAQYQFIHKVSMPHDGPTNKADCLNTIYRGIATYEQEADKPFAIVIMHDAEDVVHPLALLLHNYLIPRVDAVQLPILPLPTPYYNMVHWHYADEFAENHMKDIVARERMGGFVPFAGVGTAFSRRALEIVALMRGDDLFNTSTLTEDYSLSRAMKVAGLKTIFVNVLLGDDKSSRFTPLYRRAGFISNWSYFPNHFWRAVRQKTRWILGISLLEWESTGWDKNVRILANLIKDRKVLVAMAVTLMGYLVMLYFAISWLCSSGVLGWKWIPLFSRGSYLHALILVDSGLMVIRLVQKFAYVAVIYGPIAGLLALPRTVLANVINGIASYRALTQFSRYRRGLARMTWDKTQHSEGVGVHPGVVDAPNYVKEMIAVSAESTYGAKPGGVTSFTECPKEMEAQIECLLSIPRDLQGESRDAAVHTLVELSASDDAIVRGSVAKACGYLKWPEVLPVVTELIYDREWVVRANASTAVLKFDDFIDAVMSIFNKHDSYAWNVVIRAIEQDSNALRQLSARLSRTDSDIPQEVKHILLQHSQLLRHMQVSTPVDGIPSAV